MKPFFSRKRPCDVDVSQAYYGSRSMACEATLAETEAKFDSALQHALFRLGVATITPKPEQRKAM